jgi:hypothetical protein
MLHLFPVWSRCLPFPSKETQLLHKPSLPSHLSVFLPKSIVFFPNVPQVHMALLLPSTDVCFHLLFSYHCCFACPWHTSPSLLLGCVIFSHCNIYQYHLL